MSILTSGDHSNDAAPAMLPRATIISVLNRITVCLLFSVLLTLVSCSWYDSLRGVSIADKIRANALATAKKEGKLVLLVFGIHDKSWSDRLDQFHADPQVSSVLDKYFVLARIDMEQPGGTEMYLQRGERGAPAFSILDARGTHLSDSGQAEENFGFPNNPDQVDRYVEALKTACPVLTDDEVKILRQKLDQMRVAPPE
jgi:hypothetical protein